MFRSLHGYRREWITGDLSGALTLLAIAIPEQLATSRLAGMPPVTGYYAFIAAAVAFAALGRSRWLSLGADSTIAPMIGAGLAPLALAGSARYTDLAGILAVGVGLVLLLVWALRLGWVSEFLSVPIITGFLGGIAVVVVVHQLPDLLGLGATAGNNLSRLVDILRELGSVNLTTLAVGTGVIAVTVSLQRINRRLPAALISLVLATLSVSLLNLTDHGVAVLGSVAHGLPQLGLRGLSFSVLGQIAPIAAIVALVVVSQSAATARAFPDADENPTGDAGKDLLGAAAANVLSGLLGSFAVNASPPRTAASLNAGTRTQASSLIAAAALACLIPAMGLLKDIPVAALAGILITVAARILDVRQLRAIARFDRFEFALAAITLLTVGLIGVEQGIAVAVGLAIVDRARIGSHPHLHVLGRIPGSTSWAPVTAPEHPQPQPGVLVVLYATPLWYANAAHFRMQLLDAIASTAPQPTAVVLDALGMTDIDFTGAEQLRSALSELNRRGIDFRIARLSDTARRNLRAAGLLEQIGEGQIYSAVDEAVGATTRVSA